MFQGNMTVNFVFILFLFLLTWKRCCNANNIVAIWSPFTFYIILKKQ